MTLFKGIGQDVRIKPANNTKQVVLKNRIYCKDQSGKKNEDMTVLQTKMKEYD
jgi:hypothetical protein